MSYAPDDLMSCRDYIRRHSGLPADAVGIVGDPAHDGGYHCGKDRTDPDDYSRDESPRDAHPTNGASALDIGDFRLADGRTQRHLAEFVVAACKRNDPRAGSIREVIYTPVGGSTVKRHDELGIRTTGDSSHLYHGHYSFYRDSEGRRAGMDDFMGLLAEFFEGITGSDDMGNTWLEPLTQGNPGYAGHQRDTALAFAWSSADTARANTEKLIELATAEKARDAAFRTAFDALASTLRAGGGDIDTAALLDRVDEAVRAEVEPLRAMLAEYVERERALRGELAAALSRAGG